MHSNMRKLNKTFNYCEVFESFVDIFWLKRLIYYIFMLCSKNEWVDLKAKWERTTEIYVFNFIFALCVSELGM